jgi:hypothetical protein
MNETAIPGKAAAWQRVVGVFFVAADIGDGCRAFVRTKGDDKATSLL